MDKAINAIFPIFFIMMLGFYLKNSKQQNHFKEDFWSGLEKLLFNILFPATLIGNVSISKINQSSIFQMVGILVISIAIIFYICILIKKKMQMQNAQLTSLLQGSTRYNTYVFLSIASSLFSNEKILLAVNLSAYMIIFMNVFFIIIFNILLSTGVDNIFNIIIKNISRSPMIIASIIGLLIRELDITIYQSISNSLIFLGNASFCISYLIIGSTLRFNIKENFFLILIANTLKLLIFPTIVFAITKILAIDKTLADVCILFSAVPTATNGHIMAKHFGGDYRLIADIASIGILFSIVTMFVVFLLFLS